MIKFSHSVFALPFALMAAFLAARAACRAGRSPAPWPDAGQLILIVLCMVAARAVAMTFNRIVDAGIDARNPRTADRAIPAGRISRTQAGGFLSVAALVFIISCAGFRWWYANPWPLIGCVPVLAYLCFYSYTKRFTAWSHYVLGSALALSPVAAWIAIHPASLGWPAVVLAAAVTLWVGGFDVLYACQDEAVDRREGLHSLPVRFGATASLWIARASHLATVILLIALVPLGGLGWLYRIGVAVVALLLLTEHLLIRPQNLSRIPLVLFTINGAVSLLLGLATIADVVCDPGSDFDL